MLINYIYRLRQKFGLINFISSWFSDFKQKNNRVLLDNNNYKKDLFFFQKYKLKHKTILFK